MSHADGPLLVFGPRSLDYDFGPDHPLTQRRFRPGIDLLRSLGAKPALAPEPATDADLVAVHLPAYVDAVRAFSRDPSLPGRFGVGHSDNPPFHGMHEAAAAVAGGSLRAMEAILRGDVEHAYHPGGGLHHAMPDRASGFCVYDDPALAVVRARAEGLRVLYLDFDVHHGDGVQAICYRDPGVLTLSVHESGRYLFPGTGFPDELGEAEAAGTSLNVPLEPLAGETAWLAGVRALVPSVAAVFGPDVVVSQHGADSHAWDPLAHLRVTTTAMAEAARLADAVAHRWAGGRWLATGGGGYDAYRVVPRAWALTWLAGAHREPPEATPAAWRERWEDEAAGFGTPGMPPAFLDPPNAGRSVDAEQAASEARSGAVVAAVRPLALPRLVREAEDRGWWRPALSWAGRPLGEAAPGRRADARPRPATGSAAGDVGRPVIAELGRASLDRLLLAHRTMAPFDPDDGRTILGALLGAGGRVVAAVTGDTIVGVAATAPSTTEAGCESLLALGVAPGARRDGVAHELLRRLVAGRPPGTQVEALVTVAERDVVGPLPVSTRAAVARRLLERGGFDVRDAPPGVARHDRTAIAGRLPS